MPTNDRGQLEIWDGMGRPIVGQFINDQIQVVRLFPQDYIVRNISDLNVTFSTFGSAPAVVTLSPNHGARIAFETGVVNRGNYATSYRFRAPPPPVVQGTDTEADWDSVVLGTPISVQAGAGVDVSSPPSPPTPPGHPDPRGPWRGYSAGNTEDVLDSAANWWIRKVPTYVDYIQPHPVRLMVPTGPGGEYTVHGERGISGSYNWGEVAYSRAYRAYVLRQDMLQGADVNLVIRRDDFGYFWKPTENGAVVSVNWQQGNEHQFQELVTIERFLRDHPGDSGQLVVPNEAVYGLALDSEGYPIGSQWSLNTRQGANITEQQRGDTTVSVTEAAQKKQTEMVMRQLIETKSLKQAESLIQCGLEFEFHAINGKKRGEFGGELDEARIHTALNEYIEANHGYPQDSPQFTRWLVMNRSWPSSGRNLVYKGILETGMDLGTALVGELQSHMAADLAVVKQSYLNGIRSSLTSGNNRMNYMKDIGITNWEKISPYTQLGEDSSVQGGEIRTVGPRSIPEFLTAAKVLSENAFTVGENTSLHIHMSVKGITHAYGTRFQAEMYAYILRNLHRIPDPVRKRMIAEKGCRSYAKLLLGTEKYSAIHFHKKYGTWEFRLFGNTNNYIEMRTCLQLAYEALKHAYAVKLGKSQSLLGSVTTSQIQSVLEKMMASPEKFWDTLARDTRMVIEVDAA